MPDKCPRPDSSGISSSSSASTFVRERQSFLKLSRLILPCFTSGGRSISASLNKLAATWRMTGIVTPSSPSPSRALAIFLRSRVPFDSTMLNASSMGWKSGSSLPLAKLRSISRVTRSLLPMTHLTSLTVSCGMNFLIKCVMRLTLTSGSSAVDDSLRDCSNVHTYSKRCACSSEACPRPSRRGKPEDSFDGKRPRIGERTGEFMASPIFKEWLRDAAAFFGPKQLA
mmetsp:Transcript_10012/g.26591  ORF Transcript_10012/g.26591 Transcript_10012/m.26591 type:complete len:227 (-) Transcript_10012:3-683(-)